MRTATPNPGPDRSRVTPARLRVAIDEAVARSGLLVVAMLALCFALAATLHTFAPTAWPAAPLAWGTSATALGFALLAWRLSRRPPLLRAVGPVSAACGLLVLANVLHYAALDGDSDDGLFVAIVLILAGVYVLSLRWLLVVNAAAIVGWAVVAALFVPGADWLIHPVFGAGVVAVSLLLRFTRVRAIERSVSLRDEALRQRAEAERQRAEAERLQGEAERALEDVVGAQRAVERVQNDLQAIIASNPDGMLVLRHGAVVAANRSLLAFLRQTDPGAVIGQPLGELVHPETRESTARSLATGENGSEHVECSFRRSDGERVVLEVAPTRHIVYQGEPSVLLTLRDVTARHGALQSRLMLADRMAAVGTLAAGIAHEVNNPLAFTLGNLGLLEEELSRLERSVPEARHAEVARLVTEAREGAERVRDIIRDLRLFSGGDEQREEAVDLREALRSATRLTDNEIRHRASLVLDLDDVPPVRGNSVRLGQVFLNLLLNAAQSIEVGDAEANRIVVRARVTTDGAVSIEVEDTGCGMNSEVRRRVFEPFFTTKPVGVGTGLGLSYCHAVVTQHGGTMAIDSEPGKGTRVRMTLPAAPPGMSLAEPVAAPQSDASVASTEDRPPRRTAGSKRLRILIIDDEAAIRRTLVRVFRHHDVVEAADGAAGIAALEQSEFDVVLCDLMMPRVSGDRVLEAARTLRPGIADRIVFMTGGAFTPDARSFLDGSDRPVISKPFDIPALRALVESVAASLPDPRGPG